MKQLSLLGHKSRGGLDILVPFLLEPACLFLHVSLQLPPRRVHACRSLPLADFVASSCRAALLVLHFELTFLEASRDFSFNVSTPLASINYNFCLRNKYGMALRVFLFLQTTAHVGMLNF